MKRVALSVFGLTAAVVVTGLSFSTVAFARMTKPPQPMSTTAVMTPQ